MKKKCIPFVLSGLLLATLGSCASEEPSTSESNTDTASDFSGTDSKEGLIETIQKLGELSEFTLYNEYDASTTEISQHFYRSLDYGITYVNLPVHKGEARNLAYKVQYLENGDPYVSSMAYRMDAYGNRYEINFDDFNYFKDASMDLTPSSLAEDGHIYTTEAPSVLSSFNSFYGISSTSKATFWFGEGNTSLNFEIFASDGSSLTNGIISHIGNTKDAKLDKLVSNFSWESTGKALTKEEGSTLFDVDNTSKTDIYLVQNNERKRVAHIDFSCNKDTMSVHSVNDPDGTNNEYIYYIKEDEEGRAISYGINAQNEQTLEETRYFFSQYYLPADLDREDFRLCGDGVYRYFSLTPNVIFQTFGHVSLSSDNYSFEDITLQFKDGKVSSISMKAEISSSSYYEAVTTLKPYEEITIPNSYTEEGPKEITRAMSYFDGKRPFKAVRKYGSNTDTYFFDGTTYLIQEEYVDGISQKKETTVYGFTEQSDGKILPFRKIKGKDKLVQSDDILEGDTITNHFPKLISPSVIQKESNGLYKFKNLVTDATSSVWMPGNADPQSAFISLNKKGLLDSITYELNYSSVTNGSVLFFYDNISLPEGIDITNIGPLGLTSYEDDSPDEWEDLVEYIGEKYAKMIPYYYDKKNVGNWYAEGIYSSGTGVPHNGAPYDTTPLIGVSLYCFGSSVPTSVLDEGFIQNGFTRVEGDPIDVGYRDEDWQEHGYESEIYYVDPAKQPVWLSADGKLRVIYANSIPYHNFEPSKSQDVTLGTGSSTTIDESTLDGIYDSTYSLGGSGLLIQFTDGTQIAYHS